LTGVTGLNAGRVRVFHFNGTDWQQDGQNLNGTAAGNQFGSSVAISSNGKIVASRAPLISDSGIQSGRFQVFQLNGTQL
jgi:hypothetical protein